jgi:predicted porin
LFVADGGYSYFPLLSRVVAPRQRNGGNLVRFSGLTLSLPGFHPNIHPSVSNFVVLHRNIFKEVTMKKSLIALAVLGSVAGVAQAQSSVTLYGIADVFLGRDKTEVVGVSSTSATRLESGGLQTSRFGLMGSEDLGGGLKAIFKLEQGFRTDTGVATNPGTAFDRQAYVGLEGGFGNVQFGNTWSAYDDVFYVGNSIFDAVAFSPAYRVLSVAQYNDKPRNAIRYTTPNMGGFSAAVSHGLKEAGIVDQTDFNVQYAGGPLTVAFAHQVQNNAGGLNVDTKFTYLAAAYDLGVATLRGGLGQGRNTVFGAKTSDYQIGADFPLSSALTLSAGYAASKDKDVTPETKRQGFAFGATYALSKRTTAYAAYTNTKEKTAGTTTEKFNIVGAGIRHTF